MYSRRWVGRGSQRGSTRQTLTRSGEQEAEQDGDNEQDEGVIGIEAHPKIADLLQPIANLQAHPPVLDRQHKEHPIVSPLAAAPMLRDLERKILDGHRPCRVDEERRHLDARLLSAGFEHAGEPSLVSFVQHPGQVGNRALDLRDIGSGRGRGEDKRQETYRWTLPEDVGTRSLWGTVG